MDIEGYKNARRIVREFEAPINAVAEDYIKRYLRWEYTSYFVDEIKENSFNIYVHNNDPDSWHDEEFWFEIPFYVFEDEGKAWIDGLIEARRAEEEEIARKTREVEKKITEARERKMLENLKKKYPEGNS